MCGAHKFRASLGTKFCSDFLRAGHVQRATQSCATEDSQTIRRSDINGLAGVPSNSPVWREKSLCAGAKRRRKFPVHAGDPLSRDSPNLKSEGRRAPRCYHTHNSNQLDGGRYPAKRLAVVTTRGEKAAQFSLTRCAMWRAHMGLQKECFPSL
jgi:hypothetical protein